jgi:nitroreductase
MLATIRQRRSVHNFLKKKVEKEKVHEILTAAMFAPTSMNQRPWEFIVITEDKTKNDLSKATAFSSFTKIAPVIIVISYNTNKSNRFQEDCALSAENIYLETTHQGLGTCYVQIAGGMEGNVGDPEDHVRRILNIPESHRILCLMPIGYPANQTEPHKDAEFDESKIHYEKF